MRTRVFAVECNFLCLLQGLLRRQFSANVGGLIAWCMVATSITSWPWVVSWAHLWMSALLTICSGLVSPTRWRLRSFAGSQGAWGPICHWPGLEWLSRPCAMATSGLCGVLSGAEALDTCLRFLSGSRTSLPPSPQGRGSWGRCGRGEGGARERPERKVTLSTFQSHIFSSDLEETWLLKLMTVPFPA